jgi:hypothetical protein
MGLKDVSAMDFSPDDLPVEPPPIPIRMNHQDSLNLAHGILFTLREPELEML